MHYVLLDAGYYTIFLRTSYGYCVHGPPTTGRMRHGKRLPFTCAMPRLDKLHGIKKACNRVAGLGVHDEAAGSAVHVRNVRNRRHQILGVGMLRIVQHHLRIAHFH